MLLTLLLAGYLAALLAIGLASRKAASREEASYYVADRSFGSWRGFVGLASATTGGSSTVVCAALVYRYGLPGVWLDLAGALGLFVLGLALAGRVRRTGAMTLPEIAGKFYGPAARGAAGLLVVVAEVAWFALLIEASQEVLTATMHVDPTRALLLSAAVFIFYTAIGGQYAVVRTDLLQYGLMVAGILIIGTGSALAQHGARLDFPPEALRFPFAPGMGARPVASWLVLIGLPHLVGSDVYGKLLSCRDERSARHAAWGAAASKVAFGLGVAWLALCLRQAAAPLASPNQALPLAILRFAPAGAAALAVVALLATMQSAADSVLLSAAASSVRDVAPVILRRKPGIAAARWLVPIYGGLGLLLALRQREIVETLKLGYSIFAAGMILPILFGFFRRLWLPAADVIAAMTAGGAVAVAGWFGALPAGSPDPVIAGTAVNLAVLLFGIGRTRLAGKCPGDYGLALRA